MVPLVKYFSFIFGELKTPKRYFEINWPFLYCIQHYYKIWWYGLSSFQERFSPYLSALDFFSTPVWNLDFDELFLSPTRNIKLQNPILNKEFIVFLNLYRHDVRYVCPDAYLFFVNRFVVLPNFHWYLLRHLVQISECARKDSWVTFTN